jgi:adenylate cyclase
MSDGIGSRIRTLSRLSAGLTAPRLSAVMALGFVSLCIPVLVFILAFNYSRTSAVIIAHLDEQVAKARLVTLESAQALILPVASTLRLLAQIAVSDPKVFRTEQSRELLYRALTSAEQIDAIYVSFEDGYHRVVTRIDENRRRSDPKIPRTAQWHSSYIDGFAAGPSRRRHRTFFDTWPHVVGAYDVGSTVDIRTLPHYMAAKGNRSLAVTDVSINPDTGFPVISLGFPISHDGAFLGFAGANITVDVLSRSVDRHRASPNSTTAIVERGGAIIAYPDSAKQVRIAEGKLTVARVADIEDGDLREAYRLRAQWMGDDFMFRSPATGRELSASFARFPEGFPRPWEIVILTPTDDFVGALKAANRQAVIVIAVLTALELLLIYALSTRLSRPIEGVSRALQSMETLSFAPPAAGESKSWVSEIAQLQRAVARVRASLRSFARYAPEEIVRAVAASGQETALSGDRREVTVMFCDLRGFTAAAEKLEPEQVVAILNDHFETLAGLIARHAGYVVDFLGDGLFAVFGAPEAAGGHAERAVACAIEMQLAREARNREMSARGWPPLEMGIGLNTGLAVVGNMGSDLRTKYGVVGHPVNLAARIESFTVGGQVFVSDSTREVLGERLVADGPLEADAKGVSAHVHMWVVRRLEGERPLELPAPASELVVLDSAMEVRLRLFRGKQVGAETYAAMLTRLGARGGELDTDCPLTMFDAVQVILPPESGIATALDGKVMTITERASGRRSVLVRFGGLDWGARAQLEALARVAPTRALGGDRSGEAEPATSLNPAASDGPAGA